MTSRNDRLAVAFLIAVLAVLFIPWLGMTPFNTKGEPREAIVAVSMLQSGNWILPVSFGADIPYKPPFLAWCIAAVSLLTGHVSEFTSRLPSAIAVIALAVMTHCFFRRATGSIRTGLVTALVMASSIEVWRAGYACRVDMVLTAFMVGVLYALYRWRARGYRGVPLTAVICMTCAVLTKGPVGMILPCLVGGVYGLIRGDRFLPLLLRYMAVGVASLVVPALWYVAAYGQGGDEFMRLAMEENFGRMAGTMSYSSHEKGLWYNFVTVALGMLPYTLLALFALFAVKWRKLQLNGWPSRFAAWLRGLSDADLFAFVTVMVIFVFYCIPKSKRSVYLLPIYPFLAYYIVCVGRFLMARRPNLARTYAAVISMAAILVSATALTVRFSPAGALPAALEAMAPSAVGMAVALLTLVVGVYLGWCLWMRKTEWCVRSALGVTILTLCCLSAAVLPGVLASKSDREAAAEIAAIVPESEPIYSYMDVPLLRYYTINYYLDDRLRLYEKELPVEGYMIVCEEDLEAWERNYGGIYTVTTLYTQPHKSCDRKFPAMLVKFEAQ